MSNQKNELYSAYTNLNLSQIYQQLDTSSSGLNHQQVQTKIKQYGPNEITDQQTGIWSILSRQFRSPFVYLQIIASLLSWWLGETTNAILIAIFTIINTTLGFFQEYKAEQATQLLKNYLPNKTQVIRRQQKEIIDKKWLVPGDLVILEPGSIIPADLRLIFCDELSIDESTLTGESISTNKNPRPSPTPITEIFKAKNIAFAGTTVTSGTGQGLVIATGKNTTYGQIGVTVNQIQRQSTYEKELMSFSRLILRFILLTILLIFILNNLIKGGENFYDFFIFCIALIVGIVPEALPVVATWSLSQGALKLAKEKVIVKRLSAIEDLGNIQILCTDKTGTLTENKLSLKKICSPNQEQCLIYSLTGENQKNQNPFIKSLTNHISSSTKKKLLSWQLVDQLTFDSFRMRSSLLVKNQNNQQILITKGAPEKIIDICSSFPTKYPKTKLKQEITDWGKKGYRTLAIAYKKYSKNRYQKKDESKLKFLGYFVFQDPLKPTAQSTIKLSRRLGLQIKIITGDSPEVAAQVAKKIGLITNTNQLITGQQLENLDKIDFIQACQNHQVFARVSPETKHNIIESLSQKFEVGYIGDGINDTLALKTANVGISADSATDVARAAADIILLHKDLKVIVDGIKRGRNIYANINKYIKCTLASSFGNCYSLAIISLLIPYLPMLPIQLLLVNLLSDLPLIAVASDSIDIEELKRPKMYQLKETIYLILGLAVISSIFDIIFFLIFRTTNESNLQTLWFIESIITEIILIYSLRTRHLFFRAQRPGNYLLLFSCLAISLTFIFPLTAWGQKIFFFTSLSPHSLLIILLLVICYFILSEIYKLTYYKFFNKKSTNSQKY